MEFLTKIACLGGYGWTARDTLYSLLGAAFRGFDGGALIPGEPNSLAKSKKGDIPKLLKGDITILLLQG